MDFDYDDYDNYGEKAINNNSYKKKSIYNDEYDEYDKDYFVDRYKHESYGYLYDDNYDVVKEKKNLKDNNIDEEIAIYNDIVDKYEKHLNLINQIFRDIDIYVKNTNKKIREYNEFGRNNFADFKDLNEMQELNIANKKSHLKKINIYEYQNLSEEEVENILEQLIETSKFLKMKIKKYNSTIKKLSLYIQQHYNNVLNDERKYMRGGKNKFEVTESKIENIAKKIEDIGNIFENFESLKNISLFSREYENFAKKIEEKKIYEEKEKKEVKGRKFEYHNYSNIPFISFDPKKINIKYENNDTIQLKNKYANIQNEKDIEENFYNTIKQIQGEKIQEEEIEKEKREFLSNIDKIVNKELNKILEYRNIKSQFNVEKKTRISNIEVVKNNTEFETLDSKIKELEEKLKKDFELIGITEETDLNEKKKEREKENTKLKMEINNNSKKIQTLISQLDGINANIKRLTAKKEEVANENKKRSENEDEQKRLAEKNINIEFTIEKNKENIEKIERIIQKEEDIIKKKKQLEILANKKNIAEEEKKNMDKKQKFTEHIQKIKSKLLNKIQTHNIILFNNLDKIKTIKTYLKQEDEIAEIAKIESYKSKINDKNPINIDELKNIFLAQVGGIKDFFSEFYRNEMQYNKFREMLLLFEKIVKICDFNKSFIYDELFKYVVLDDYENKELLINITYDMIKTAKINMKKYEENPYLKYTINYINIFFDETDVEENEYIILDSNKNSFEIILLILFFSEK
jgi:hypothetical protein